MKRLKFACTIKKVNDTECDKSFSSEIMLNVHLLFDHGFLMPICSTGIDEKLFHDNMQLIKEFRATHALKIHARGNLKNRFLKSMYGKRYNMKDEIQHNYFISSLENHDKHLHSRLEFIDHKLYDTYRDLEDKLEKILEKKGIVNR